MDKGIWIALGVAVIWLAGGELLRSLKKPHRPAPYPVYPVYRARRDYPWWHGPIVVNVLGVIAFIAYSVLMASGTTRPVLAAGIPVVLYPIALCIALGVMRYEIPYPAPSIKAFCAGVVGGATFLVWFAVPFLFDWNNLTSIG